MTDIEKEALEIIGASIQAHGYFFVTDILYANRCASTRIADLTKEKFFQMVVDYYDLNKDVYSTHDQQDVTKAKGCKRFVKRHIDNESMNIGLEWLREHTFKE